MWDLPGPGLEPVSSALAGGLLTTVPPGKPHKRPCIVGFHLDEIFRTGKSTDTESRLLVAQGRGPWGNSRVRAKGCVFEVMKMF